MAKKDAQMDEEIIDLTELIESGNRGDKRATSAYVKAAAANDTGDDEDFAAILAETSGEAGHKVDPDEQLDMSGMGGIDNLLDSLDIPSQTKSAEQQSEAADADLDSALDDLLGADEPKAGVAPDTDLDSLLDDISPGSKQAKKPQTGADAELDALLDGMEPETAPAAKKAAPPRKDIDDLLKEAPAKQEMAQLDSDLDDILSSFDSPAESGTARQPGPPEADETSIAADLDDILGDVEPPSPPKTPPPATHPEIKPAPEEDEAASPEPAQQSNQPAASENPDLPDAIDVPGELDDLLDSSLPPSPPAPDLPAQMQPAARGADSLPMQTGFSPDTLLSICRNLSSGPDPAAQQALQSFARELGEQTAHMEDLTAQITQMGKRLLACESKLSAARARIASLEKAMESTAALEDLLKQGSALHSGFMALISTAVSNALKGFQVPSADPGLQGKVDKLISDTDNANRRMAGIEGELAGIRQGRSGIEEEIGRLIADNDNSGAKIKSIEKKLSMLEQDFGKELEKAAAATIAKLLHDEISRLAQE